MLKVNNEDNRTCRRSGASIVNFEHILHFVLGFLLLIWAGKRRQSFSSRYMENRKKRMKMKEFIDQIDMIQIAKKITLEPSKSFIISLTYNFSKFNFMNP